MQGTIRFRRCNGGGSELLQSSTRKRARGTRLESNSFGWKSERPSRHPKSRSVTDQTAQRRRDRVKVLPLIGPEPSEFDSATRASALASPALPNKKSREPLDFPVLALDPASAKSFISVAGQ